MKTGLLGFFCYIFGDKFSICIRCIFYIDVVRNQACSRKSLWSNLFSKVIIYHNHTHYFVQFIYTYKWMQKELIIMWRKYYLWTSWPDVTDWDTAWSMENLNADIWASTHPALKMTPHIHCAMEMAQCSS
jgi:hypothetical protein